MTSNPAKKDCPCCGSRDVTDAHLVRCRISHAARTEAEAHGAARAIPDVTTADLWAHLGHVASPHDATRIVRQVVDLGWRPVVGSDPRRLWSPTTSAEGRTSEEDHNA
jgi:hypothetical protein